MSFSFENTEKKEESTEFKDFNQNSHNPSFQSNQVTNSNTQTPSTSNPDLKNQIQSNQSQSPSNLQNAEENNSIFIGKKPIKNYLSSIKLQLNKNRNADIKLKARGKFISKAVDIAELSKRNPSFNLNTNNIYISTEEYKKEDSDNLIKVSTIEIHLTKK